MSSHNAPAAKKVFIKTYGCQMNVYDSDRMADALAPAGFTPTQDQTDADLILLNTCHIREKAAEKVYSELGRLRKVKGERAALGKETMIGVAGCVAQAEGEEIAKRAGVVDLVVGPQSYSALPDMVARAGQGERVVLTEFPDEDKFDVIGMTPKKVLASRGPTAFLTVQEGCDKFCTFCVVPYTRGAEVSRDVAKILAEAHAMVDAGVREITLLGQNVNAYHGEGPDGQAWSLAKLLYALAEIDGLWRLRYTTSHPRDMDDDLIVAHRDLPEVMPYLHLPVQSGSDRILKAMNRRHTADEYRRLIDRIRAVQPDLALSGDFIVGFPGETDQDFDDTMQLIRDVEYAAAFSFKYSPRPGTPGALMDDHVPDDVMTQRLHALQALITSQQQAFQQSRVGRSFPVLFEKIGRNEGQLVGRSPWLQPVNVQAPKSMLRSLQTVTITHTGTNSLFADLAESGPISTVEPMLEAAS
ncbi:MAG: tRNA (N6-isopentenyl adenosine(37)-C2)-methylthiotransferase MiaB [Rhizobiales bacterium]|nr:tRNA (N6-isopentenyl adenosine(37)-C2)-methylthiotransferase MiaB [Hyphomicrobiales bacterium]MBO6699460.1 tRNA (N6-isopentenyl adenosine(37)-C2)-methylthiotransferase MiaB [Hyphomicrobiales bacterium]MBO6736998.1 tRNA (N6-isopentenyl adenosine(37)-C2)-methylthiotransferase MiaB [Hyphomicrobiales bacterium]MBO6911928.1 tRNA (N6-isopentenyl adenosine(37)-C2)-methylthiotransferase MiaB [Hyphomicrobiales bacterium]MBO6956897.1 tRNA (N6-isopentenyl adenosine(37)-C2)-methylthiotransferase MiaB [H